MIVKSLDKEQSLDMIAALASTPVERLQSGWVTTASGSAQARLQRLYKLVGAEDEEKRQRLLDQLQISHEQLVRSLSLPGVTEVTQLPAWVKTLEQIMTYEHVVCTPMSGDVAEAMDPCLLAEQPLPFEEFFLPFIRYAREQLLEHVPMRSALLSQEAYGKLERWLLELLTSQASQVLQNEFAGFRKTSAGNDLSCPPSSNDESPTTA